MQHYRITGTLLIAAGGAAKQAEIERSPIPAWTPAQAIEAVRWSFALCERYPDQAVTWADVRAELLPP